ncbi:oocyte zinc finger protein XlCOF7.1-like [Anomaloglossus baeobatrachus]
MHLKVRTISDPPSGNLLYKRIFLMESSRMDKDRDKMAKRILHLALEILFRLTGEDYTVVKKTSSERCQDTVSERLGRSLNPITGPSRHPLIHKDINDQKILELTYKMIELLTGEVPIRCQDVTIYFSMEEWEYLEGNKDLYKAIMMEVPQPLISPDLFSKRTTPERCPHPLLPQECKQENPNVPQDHQGEDLTHITTETYVRGDEQSIEEVTADNSPDNCTRRLEGQLTSSVFKSDNFDITQDTIEENAIIPDLPSSLHSKEQSLHPFKQVISSDSSQTIKKTKSHKGVKSGEIINRKSDLVKFERIHTGKKRFSCSECEKCFAHKSNLVLHQRTHTGEKLLSCLECGKCFVKKSYLDKHKRSHTGEQPYSCLECGKCFAEKSNFIRHQKMHTGEKPFSCSVCGKCFAHKMHFVTHQRRHTGEKPYSCSDCGKCFTDKSNVVRHKKIHTGEKPYSCSECGKCFPHKRSLLEHQKYHTGGAWPAC